MRTKFAVNFGASAASATELFLNLLSAAQGLRRSGVPRACAHVRRRGSVNFSGSRRRRLVDCSVGFGSRDQPFASAIVLLTPHRVLKLGYANFCSQFILSKKKSCGSALPRGRSPRDVASRASRSLEPPRHDTTILFFVASGEQKRRGKLYLPRGSSHRVRVQQ